MPRAVLQGSLTHRLRSLFIAVAISFRVYLRRAIGRPLVRSWTSLFEYGTLFYRAQFNHAFALADIAEGRAYFDSLYTELDGAQGVLVRPSGPGEPRGDWFLPPGGDNGVTMLYFHGGGYTFYAAATRQLIAILAKALGVRIFAPDYRLTPEHPHPAQLEDALAAYRFLIDSGVEPRRLVMAGDSAGGHLVLMTLSKLRGTGLPMPALTMGLSPWTDTGRRGRSQFGNDPYDLVQGYMTLRFAEWLRGTPPCSDQEVSPIAQDFTGLGPIYLQAGGREILVDMIRDFAQVARAQGARVRLDVWEEMNHEFQAYADDVPEARDAIERLAAAVAWATGERQSFPVCPRTEVDSLAE